MSREIAALRAMLKVYLIAVVVGVLSVNRFNKWIEQLSGIR